MFKLTLEGVAGNYTIEAPTDDKELCLSTAKDYNLKVIDIEEIKMSDIQETLDERESTHGDFERQSATSQAIKQCMRGSPNWKDLTPPQKEALEMVALKVARILHGDPDYVDSWHDACGYPKLVENILREAEQVGR